MEKDFNNIDEKSLIDDERIAKYLKGKMTANEEQAFMRDLETNAELKEKAIAMARLAKAMKEVGKANDEEVIGEFLAADSDEIKEIISGATKEDVAACAMRAEYTNSAAKPASAQKRSLRRSLTWLSAVASVAILIWAGISFYNSRMDYQAAQDSISVYRGDGINTEVEKELSSLYNNISEEKNLTPTLDELAKYWELATQDTYNEYTDYAYEIGLNLALGYVKINNREKAIAILERLTNVAPTDTSTGDKTRELLKKVDE